MLSGAHFTNRWQITGGNRPPKSSRSGPALNANDYIESCDSAATKWAAGAAEMSRLSVDYPNLIAFNIDDFQAHAWRKGNWGTPETEPTGAARVRSQGYSRANVQEIYRGCRAHNENFQFWPTHYVNQALKTAIPAVTIGFTYDFPTLADDYITATWRFWVRESALGGTIKLLYADYYGTWDTHVDPHDTYKQIYFNGATILSESIGGDDRIQTLTYDAGGGGHLTKGWNTIVAKISDPTKGSRNDERLFAVGDLQFIQRTENRLDSPTTTLTVENGGITSASFSINGSPTGSRPGSGTTPGDTALLPFSGGWVAEINEPYRYIADCDRFFLYYSNHTGAIKARLPDIFDAYRRHCPGSGIIHGQQGFLFDQDCPQIVQKFMTGSTYSDGVVVWNYPLYMNQPTKGIFSKRDVPAGGTMVPACPAGPAGLACRQHNSITASIQTTFPSWQLAVRGQYQRWTTKKTYHGDVKFKVQTVGGTADPYFYWRTILAPSGATWPPASPYYDISGAYQYTTPVSTSATTLVNKKLVFETFVNSGYGDSYAQIRLSASIMDQDGSEIAHLSASAWDFTSGVTGTMIPDLYTSLKTYYEDLDTERATYNNYIIERTRGVLDPGRADYWTFYAPADGDRVYVSDPGEYRIYEDDKERWTRESTYYAYSDALTVSGSMTCTDAIARGGFFHAVRSATASFNWATPSSLSGAISWDAFPRLDTAYYSGSGPDILVRKTGDYKIAYGISWYQTGAMPPISLKAYVVSSSAVGRPGSPYPRPDIIKTLDSSLSYTVVDGPAGGYTRGTNSATFMTSIKSTDTLKLYVEHDYGTLPSTTSTVAKQAWIIIEKV